MLILDKDSVCYILCLCVEKELVEIVKGMDDDIKEMWKWFDEKYGDLVKLMDVIINII